MAAMATLASAGLGAAGSIGGMIKGSPASNVQMPPQFNMPFQTNAAANAYGGAGILSNNMLTQNFGQQLLPQYWDLMTSLGQNNPGAGGMVQGAQNASQMGAGAANQMYGAGSYLSGLGQSLGPYAQQILQTGFDPQQALYDRTQHQVMEQSRAGGALRGLGNSPFAQGLENDATRNFNIDWQNAQLGRQVQGAQGASGLIGTGQNAITGGSGLMAGAPGLMQQTSMMPYMAYNQIGADRGGALDKMVQAGLNANTMPQQNFQNWLSYLGMGNQAGQVANQNAKVGLDQAGLSFGQNQALGQGLGNSIAGLGKAYAGWSGGGGNSNQTGWATNPWSSGGMFGSGVPT